MSNILYLHDLSEEFYLEQIILLDEVDYDNWFNAEFFAFYVQFKFDQGHNGGIEINGKTYVRMCYNVADDIFYAMTDSIGFDGIYAKHLPPKVVEKIKSGKRIRLNYEQGSGWFNG